MAVDVRFFGHDAQAGILETFQYDDVTDMVTIETIQNCDPIVEGCKAEYNMYDESAKRYENFFKVGSIPLAMLEEIKRMGIDPFSDDGGKWIMKNVINNRDYMALRTRPGVF